MDGERSEAARGSGALRLLIVCTGNICRSPMAEAAVRHALAAAGLAPRVEVASAGTWDGNAGEPADPRAIAVAAQRGYDLSSFRARALERADFGRFAVMLGMAGSHVTHLEAMRPRGSAPLIRRYLDFTPDLAVREVGDPYLGAPADFAAALDLIERGVPGIVAFLRQRCAGR